MILCCVVIAGLQGCAGKAPPVPEPIEITEIHIRFTPEHSLVDESVLAQKMETRQIQKVMVVPPSGTAGAAFNRGLSNAERVPMRLGIELISPAIGGRVVASGSTDESGNEAGVTLSDLERVLVLAEASHAEAVLQIGDIEYQTPDSLVIDHRRSEGWGARYMVLDDSTRSVTEVSFGGVR